MRVKLSQRDNSELIRKMKDEAKRDPEIKKVFEKYDVPLSAIDDVSVEFVDLDVSAKTKDKKIYLNKKMLEKNSDADPRLYFWHEITHLCQQIAGVSDEDKNEDYLDKETELEAFERQINKEKEDEGFEEAERYTEDLLDYHNIKGKEREKKKKELLGD